jgi:hypothetical protein
LPINTMVVTGHAVPGCFTNQSPEVALFLVDLNR